VTASKKAAPAGSRSEMADQEFIDALDQSREVELTVVGRRSGQKTARPVWFVRADRKVQLVPIYGTDSAWYKNVKATPTVRLAVRAGREVEAQAVPVTESRRLGEIVEAFRAKYGNDEFERYYPKPDAAVEVSLD
jgi:deazaflavin-dependent oxidoreductase (nitroreductase family)